MPEHLRRVNRRLVLDHLLRVPSCTRAQLAAALTMSPPTAGKVIAELLRDGVIEEVDADPPTGAAPTTLGRPGRLLRMQAGKPRFLLVQLGVEQTRLAAAGLTAPQQDDWPIAFATPARLERWFELVHRHAAKLPLVKPWGVLLSVPGVVDEPAGRVVFSPNLHQSEGLALRDQLAQRWGAPVCLVQEIRALALGHMLASGADDFLLVDFGDGVGGAAVIGSRLFQGPLPLNSELGHNVIAGNRRRCGCGGRGCLETRIGRRGLLQSFAARHRVTQPRWGDLVEHVQGRRLPRWLVDDLQHAAAHVAATLNVLGLRRVVISGLLGELGDRAFAAFDNTVRGAAMWQRFGQVDIQCAPRRRMAGLIAAGLDRIVSPMPAWRHASTQAEQEVNV